MKTIILLLALVLYAGRPFAQTPAHSIDSLVNAYTVQSEFNGSLLVARQGKIILSKGYGFADVKNNVLNTPATIFNIASLTKTFTAAIIVKLEKQGRLSFQDPVGKFMPDFPGGDQITIRHLLTHTSGIPDYLQDKMFQSIDQSREVTLLQMIGFFKGKPLDFVPGTKFRYSNSGYTLLGYIIELLTDDSYATALRKMIFEPLKMQHSSYGPGEKNGSPAQGYQMYFKNFKRTAVPVHPSISYATGAIYSTVEDLYKWHRALQTGFFDKALLDSIYKKDTGPYGFGWFTDTLYGWQRVSHDGNIAGYKANINRMPGEDLCVIALSNANNSSVGGMVRNIINQLCGQPFSKSFADQPVIVVPDSVLKVFAGVYQYSDSASSIVTVKPAPGQLSVMIYGQEAFDISPVSKNQFKAKGIKVEFMWNQQGRVEAILIYKNGEFLGARKVGD